MTRKDTILIAVVINAGLLAVLFTTAVIYDTDKSLEHNDFAAPAQETKISEVEPSPTLIAAANSAGDEVDNVLKYYSQPSSKPIAVDVDSDTSTPEIVAVQSNASDDEDSVQVSHPEDNFIEVKVKKGDMLEKIARANKTTVGAIKRANSLQSEHLQIGQILKVPVKQSSESSTQSHHESDQEQSQELNADDHVYYVIKSGDNPWKIAKHFNVKYEDILRLNHLDEEKARNLKIGDRIRVK